MKTFVRLSLLSIGMIVLIGLYFEYCVNRPLNVYIQFAAGAVMLILTAYFLVHLVKQIIKQLNP